MVRSDTSRQHTLTVRLCVDVVAALRDGGKACLIAKEPDLELAIAGEAEEAAALVVHAKVCNGRVVAAQQSARAVVDIRIPKLTCGARKRER